MSLAPAKSPEIENPPDLLISVLKNPALMVDLDKTQWNTVLYEAHLLKLRGRLAADAKDYGIWEALPPKARQVLTNAEIITNAGQRKIMWELDRVKRALFGFQGKIILVKGGAYIAQGLRCSRGRNSIDLDILVLKKHLDIVEDYLLKAGYESEVLNAYDQQYYREWAHELPPLVHADRKVEVDVHHNILQVTNRLSPQIDLMINKAERVVSSIDGARDDNIYVFCREDILLHSIVHQFVDGGIKASLRNLLEQHDIITEFSRDPDFLARFMSRAEELGFGRPVFYSLRYCKYFLATDIPDDIIVWAEKFGPHKVILKIMDLMVFRALQPYGQSNKSHSRLRLKLTDYMATNGLYMRSHWLRMPPLMLLSHLMRKSLRRIGMLKA